MDCISDSIATGEKNIRVAVVGNSNSAMVISFANALARNPNLVVTNRSIGGSPSVVLLDFLAHEKEFYYDFIIIETSVCDYLLRNTYSRERSKETLQLFIKTLRLVTTAQIVILSIPTRYSLLEPGLHWQEPLYQEVAEEFGLPILDGFCIVRRLIGWPKMERIQSFCQFSKKLVSSFRLPENLLPSLVWRSLRDDKFVPNALGIYGFIDHAHFSAPMHALIGTLLEKLITSRPACSRGDPVKNFDIKSSIIQESLPIGARYIKRRSSLITRDLLVLVCGETARYHCPSGYRAIGLLVNASGTDGVLTVVSPGGTTVLNLPFGPQPSEWVAIIVPILAEIGDGDLMMTLTAAPAVESPPGKAELGEVILIKSGWQDISPPPAGARTGAFRIADAPWAEEIIDEAATQAHSVALGIEADTRAIDNTCLSFATNLLTSGPAPMVPADRARVMLVMGTTENLQDFLEAACRASPHDSELQEMRGGLQSIIAESNVSPDEILQRAISLARSDATDESDAVLAEGMARFMDRIDFFIQAARNASQRKDWPEAQRRWAQVIRMFPQSASGYVGQALDLREAGRVDDAAASLARVTQMFPQDAIGFVEQAWLANRRGAWEAATDLWASIRKKFPNHPAGYVGGAIAYQELGRAADADNTITEGRSRLPADREIAFWWGELAMRRADWKEAARRWLVLRGVFPTEPRCTLDAARALAAAGEALRAEELIEEARDHFPHDPRTAFGWADIADHQRNWRAAAERWKHVRQRFPDEKRPYKHEMRAYEELGELDAAETIAGVAVEAFSNQIDILLHAGVIASKNRDFESAMYRYGAAYSLDPQNREAVKRYVEILMKLERIENAKIVLSRAMSTWPADEVLARWWGETIKRGL